MTPQAENPGTLELFYDVSAEDPKLAVLDYFETNS